MSKSYHGHEVLEAILAEDAPVPRERLAAAMASLHGPDALYHTCSAAGMTLDELIVFLLERGKISETPDGFIAHREAMC